MDSCFHFTQVERDYEREDEDEDDEAPDLEDMEDDMISNFSHASRASHASRLFTGSQAGGDDVEISREDFENIMDDFLDNYEVVGNRMVPTLGGETGADKLEIMRKALVGLDVEGNAEASSSKVGGTDAEAEYIRKRYLRDELYQDEEEDEDAEPSWPAPPKPRDKWDAETILSEYKSHLARMILLIGALCPKRHVFQYGEPPTCHWHSSDQATEREGDGTRRRRG